VLSEQILLLNIFEIQLNWIRPYYVTSLNNSQIRFVYHQRTWSCRGKCYEKLSSEKCRAAHFGLGKWGRYRIL
jgi:hypothetical protein